ncbi:hypothetical protein HMPREF0290_2404 [Corynebacterium efficiens YS-314]|uniref:Uncharacterized protein n=1 Tax=Corynebacterium efficiens (strain DSM 44549 / YS-314 / AJ 12310 / JCM 11189 / NBRC 100395) TaxID=196164 RepID=Q8FMY5_COREF|nr:hypothetical protein HMPREF0290_2404 [Corynebacterium efficiens YS-314]BAC19174.1 hypothetical protein [Corynebacterium efficiens YS-314]
MWAPVNGVTFMDPTYPAGSAGMISPVVDRLFGGSVAGVSLDVVVGVGIIPMGAI